MPPMWWLVSDGVPLAREAERSHGWERLSVWGVITYREAEEIPHVGRLA